MCRNPFIIDHLSITLAVTLTLTPSTRLVSQKKKKKNVEKILLNFPFFFFVLLKNWQKFWVQKTAKTKKIRIVIYEFRMARWQLLLILYLHNWLTLLCETPQPCPSPDSLWTLKFNSCARKFRIMRSKLQEFSKRVKCICNFAMVGKRVEHFW